MSGFTMILLVLNVVKSGLSPNTCWHLVIKQSRVDNCSASRAYVTLSIWDGSLSRVTDESVKLFIICRLWCYILLISNIFNTSHKVNWLSFTCIYIGYGFTLGICINDWRHYVIIKTIISLMISSKKIVVKHIFLLSPIGSFYTVTYRAILF